MEIEKAIKDIQLRTETVKQLTDEFNFLTKEGLDETNVGDVIVIVRKLNAITNDIPFVESMRELLWKLEEKENS